MINKTKKQKTSPPRLYAILARESPMAVVFRRGPSKQVLTISWNTAKHEFRAGQWFKGRIYERRCDLSPSGEKLIYFAANQKEPHYSWTAVSRPPFITALMMWPKGDAWGGGGLFKTERTILLNHRAFQMGLADDFKLIKGVNVEPNGEYSGRGEDEPILPMRLMRDGWTRTQEPTIKENKHSSKIWYELPQNEIVSKTKGRWTIQMRLLGLKELDGPWYVIEHDIVDDEGNIVLALGRTDWADWSYSGDILFAKQGKLYEIAVSKKRLGEPEELIDLTNLRFEQVSPPPEALKWKGRSPKGRLIK